MTQATDPRLRHAAVLQREVQRVQTRLQSILRTSQHLCAEARRTRAASQRLREELRRPPTP